MPDTPHVLPCDREAAQAFLRDDRCPLGIKMMLNGEAATAFVEAFAFHRHRQSAMTGRVDRWSPIGSAPKDGTTFDAWVSLGNPFDYGRQHRRFTDVRWDAWFGCWKLSTVAEAELAAENGDSFADWTLTHWMPAPPAPGEGAGAEHRLIEREIDGECGCPEETWEAFGAHLNMHLAAGRPSNAHADFGDDGEREVTLTATTIERARAAIFGWAAMLDRDTVAEAESKAAGTDGGVA